MKTRHWYWIWGALFIVCAALGFLRQEQESPGWWYTAVSALFFLPPAVILLRSRKEGDIRSLKILRYLSGASLGITALGLVLNFLSVCWGDAAGDILHSILAVVSTPMIASGFWALSLFLWACLWVASGSRSKQAPPTPDR